MLHPFIPSQFDASKCASCKYTSEEHTDRATCESCGNTGTCEISGPFNHPQSMLLCMDCLDKEKQAVLEHQSPEKQEERVRNHNQEIINHARSIDTSIRVRTDIFNAKTVATIEVFQAIDDSPEISNKLAVKHEFVKERIAHLKQVIFGARETLEQANSEVYALQTQWNDQLNKLRAEVREQYKISDINYQPIPPKKIKSDAATKVKKVKEASLKMSDIRFAAATYKVPIDMVSMTARARNVSAEEAAKIVAKTLGLN